MDEQDNGIRKKTQTIMTTTFITSTAILFGIAIFNTFKVVKTVSEIRRSK